MNFKTLVALSSALVLVAALVPAQETNQVEQLKKQLQQLQENFERVQREQRQQIEALQQSQAKAPPPALATPPAAAAPPELKQPWSPSQPLTLAGGGKNYLNLSFDSLFAAGSSTAEEVGELQLGGHDPSQRGFTVQNLELTLNGAVDPYLRGQVNLIYQIDSAGESIFEVEEAFLETTSLPANLQLKAGQFFTEFGRLNPQHPHTWSFVDQPLVNGRFFGPDGLRNPGARVSWLLPTPFYAELFLAVQDSHGETAHSFRNDNEGDLLFGRPTTQGRLKSLGDLLFTPRLATSFDLSDTQTLLVGTSAALGPNGAGARTDTQIYGLDWFWKWKPARQHGGFPFVSWQTEALLRRYEAAAYDGLLDPANPVPPLPAERLTDYGVYSQISYGFRKGWVAALRGDWVSGDRGALDPDPDRDPRWRVAPNLTWYPSEFSKVRLQYNYDDRANVGTDHSVWVQFEFLLGAHGAHKF
ncbi:MAG: hypothetical protein HYY24_21855 [Verrucomicrobia bacterium]|nr:hypothetical protein [Verrucomicrobiota bacterium]